MNRPKRIVVTIDRLVLRGVAPGDTAAMVAGLQNGLQETLASQGLSANASVRLPTLPRHTFMAGRNAGATGRSAAKALHTAISRSLTGRRR